jgi:HlyD family secretion protein
VTRLSPAQDAKRTDAAAGGPSARRRRRLLALAGATAMVSLSGLGASTLVKSPMQVAAEQAPPPPALLTAEVEQRVLRDTVVLRGVVAPERAVEVTPSSSRDGGQLVVTGTPVRPGDRVRAGRVLIEVSGRPLICLPGRVPAFRDLRPGSRGKDVAQLQDALGRLGHPVGDTAGVFGSGTKRAVAALYESLGYEPATTGEDDERLLQEGRRRVRAAERALQRARRALQDATAPSGGGGTAAAAAQAALEDAQDEHADARSSQAELQARTGTTLPSSEVVFVPSLPARVDRVGGTVGSPVRAPLLVLSTGRLVVRAMLPLPEHRLVKVGQRVELVSEVLDLSAPGVVTSIAQTSGDGNPASADSGAGVDGLPTDGGAPQQAVGSGFQLTASGTIDQRLAGQDVRVTIEAASTGGPVLVVPLAAVSAGADGSSQVTAVRPGGRQERVVVAAGVSGDGFLEVRPISGRLRKGDRVVIGR